MAQLKELIVNGPARFNGSVSFDEPIGGTIIKKSVIPTDATTEIAIPTEFSDTNNMVVYYNGILMEENVNYTISDTTISAIGFSFSQDSIVTFVGSSVDTSINLNTSADQVTLADRDDVFDGAQSVESGMTALAKKFKAIMSNKNIIKKSIVLDTGGLSEIDIPSELNSSDILCVYYDGILLTENINYIKSDSKITFIGFTTKEDMVITFVGSSLDTSVEIAKYAKDVALQNASKFGDNNNVQLGMEYMESQILSLQSIKATQLTLTLNSSNWVNNVQTVSASTVTSTNAVIICPNLSIQSEYTDCNVTCTAQNDGSLTFECDKTPEIDLLINVLTF